MYFRPPCAEILFRELGALDPTILSGEPRGAIYAMVELPVEDDGTKRLHLGALPGFIFFQLLIPFCVKIFLERATEWLAKVHHVAVIPGSSCGMAGHVRVAYANVDPKAVRLHART
jgi:aspartate/methionine/tyrosine aminotransferase